jgi:NAD(P)-dependent dehydrogenase (short-subunit alcohol dehydrogenase family)
MAGKTVLITGATSGIGEVAARELARGGAHVVVVGRTAERCAATTARIHEAVPGAQVASLQADLSCLAQVRRLASEVRERHPRVDVLVNNAGAMYYGRTLSTDGIEMTFALNHVGYFALTLQLLDVLKGSRPGRIVNVASAAHSSGTIDFDDLQGARRYGAWRAYAQSKLANVLFTAELARRLEGCGVTANCLHPGFVATNFGNDRGVRGWLMRLAMSVFAISVESGAKTMVYLAASPEVEGASGGYYDRQRPGRTTAEARDPAVARRLWQVTEELTGMRWPAA